MALENAGELALSRELAARNVPLVLLGPDEALFLAGLCRMHGCSVVILPFSPKKLVNKKDRG